MDEVRIEEARQNVLARADAMMAVTLGPTVEMTFALNDIWQNGAKDGVAKWLSGSTWPYSKSQPAIYIIRAGDEKTAQLMMLEFPVADNRAFAGPKVNGLAEGSAMLYVGSTESVHKRLREHLWQGSEKTYAVHLRRWCKATEGAITVSVQPILNSKDRIVRQDLEDAVWRHLKPALGKPGGR